MKLEGAVAVITGASSGIGRATALRFAAKGADVVLAARRARALADVARECRRHGVDTLVVPTDTADWEAVSRLARRAVNRFGRIDVWVNAAAVVAFGPFEDVPLAEFERVLDVNVMGYVHGARAALPVMRQQGHGVLVNVSSAVGMLPQPYMHAYSMSKSAVTALGASLRQELWLAGERGVHVVTVKPLGTDTPIWRVAANRTGRRVHPAPPVHTAQRVAARIARTVEHPRREVTVSPAGALVSRVSPLVPGVSERLAAVMTDRVLLRGKGEAHTSGNLFEPSTDPRDTRVDGRWHGRRRTATRRLATALALVAASAAATRRRSPRTSPGQVTARGSNHARFRYR